MCLQPPAGFFLFRLNRLKPGGFTLDPDDAPHGYRVFFCNNCGYQVTAPIHCTSRTCYPCTRARAWRIRRRVSWSLANVPRTPRCFWKHVTLTIRSGHHLSERLDHLIQSFRRLRQRKLWKKSQLFGYYVIEITRGPPGWHPHLHIISYGYFLPWQKLLSDWTSVTSDSLHLHINVIRQGTSISDYIAKYVSKLPAVSPADAAEIDNATHGRRLFSPFGQAAELQRRSPLPKFRYHCPRCGVCQWIPDFLMDRMKRHAPPYTARAP